MGRDRSLDEFVGGGGDGASDGKSGSDESDGEASDADVKADDGPETDEAAVPDPREVEPATATYRWEPDGAECAACGATVERLWSDEDRQEQVCADCKEW